MTVLQQRSLTVANTTNRGVTISGDDGRPRLTLHQYGSEVVDLTSVLTDAQFVNELTSLMNRGIIRVYANGVEKNAYDVSGYKYGTTDSDFHFFLDLEPLTANDDELLIWDTSAGGYKRQAKAVFIAGIGGEANTASDVGGGAGLVAGKVGIDLQFKTLTSLGGTVTITNTATTVNLEAVGGGGTFLSLTDTPGAYTTANAIYRVNAAGNGVDETTLVYGEPAADQFSLTRGATALVVTADCTLDQDLQQSASPTFNTVFGTTFDTNVAAAGLTLSGTSLVADGTDLNIDVIITPKGAAGVYLTDTTAPGTTTNRLYSVGGTLFWNGIDITGAGVTSFIALSDTPGAYTTANAIYRVNAAGNGVDETTLVYGEPAANQFSLTRGSTALVVTADCTLDQDLQQSASVIFADATVGSLYTSDTAAGLTISSASIVADGTDANIDIPLTYKGNAGLVLPNAPAAPADTTSKLYQTGGVLYFDGVSLESTGYFSRTDNVLTPLNDGDIIETGFGKLSLTSNAEFKSKGQSLNPFPNSLVTRDVLSRHSKSKWYSGMLNFVSSDDPGGSSEGLWYDGRFIYVANGGQGLVVYSIAYDGTLTSVGSDSPGGTSYGVWGDGDYVYLAAGGAGIFSYSIASDGTPTLIDSDDQGGTYESVWGNGKFLFVCAQGAGTHVYSVNPDGTLNYVSSIDPGGESRHVTGDDKYIYVAQAGTGVISYTVSTAGVLTQVDIDDQGGIYDSVYKDERFLYTACSGDGLRTYRVDPDGTLNYLNVLSVGTPLVGVWGGGRFIYGAASGGGLYSFYVSDDGSLTVIDFDDQGGAATAVSCVSVFEKYVVLANAGGGTLVYSIGSAYDYDKVNAIHGFTGDLILNSTTSIDAILDEDDMASDSATALATQQSIKFYVDSLAKPILEGLGNPNGVATGARGQKYYDTLNLVWYICNTTGTTVWTVDG